jgi:outer membrane protein TolC
MAVAAPGRPAVTAILRLKNPSGLPLLPIRSRAIFARLASAFGLALLILASATRSSGYVPYQGNDAPDSIVSGTMPENYLPGLMDLVHAALKHSPTMISQQIQMAQAEAAMLNADSVLYPQLSAGGSYGLSSASVASAGQFGAAGSQSTGTSTSESYSISASMPVFRWGQVWNGIRIQKLSLAISRKSYAEAYRNFVVQLRDSYLALVAKRIGMRSAELNLKLTETNLAVQEANLKSGMIAQGAIIAPRMALDDSRLAYDRLVEDYEHSKRVLAQFIGLPTIPDDSVAETVPKVTYVPDVADAILGAFLRDGAKSTFQAQTLQMQLHEQKLNYDIQITRQLPGFTGYYSYSAADTTSVAFAQAVPGQAAIPASIAKVGETSISYGVSAGWDIFDGFATTAAIRTAKASRRLAERGLQNYLEATLEQSQTARRQLDFAARAMGLAERRRDLAEAALNQSLADFKFGSVPQSVVDGAKYSLYVGEQSQLSARADFLSHWSAFVSLVDADPALGQLPVQYVRATH